MDRNIVLSGPSVPAAGKNDYYRDGSRIMMWLVNVQAVVIFGLTVALVFFLNTRQNHDRYIAAANDGKGMPLIALPFPNMGKEALSDWVAEANSQIMTFGFNDVDARFAKSRKDFTADGWETFRKAVIATKLIEDMMDAQQIVTSVPESPPVLKEEGLVNGIYTWTYDVPLLVTFRAGGVKVSRSKTAHVTVEKIPTRENPNGVGISQWGIR